MSFQEIGWKILHLVWQTKGYGNKEVPPLLHKSCPHVEGLGESTIRGKVSRDELAPPEVAQFVIERMAARKGKERHTEIVLLGVAALLEQPLPKDSKPAEAVRALRAEFPTDEVALKLADALAKQGGLLDSLRAKLEALLSSLGSAVTSKLDALATSLASLLAMLAGVRRTLDALATSLASLLSLLTGMRSTLDAVNGKIDTMLGTLGLVAATVDHVDAKGDLAEYARGRESRRVIRETRRVIRAVRRVGGSVRWASWVALGGFVAVMLVLLISGRVRWVRHEEPATASVTQPPAPVVVVVNGATGTLVDLRDYLGAIAQFGKKVEENWIPNQPLPFQKDKDCDPTLGEVSINGGCWVWIAAVKPPCGKLFRHGDACYRPVAADPTKPVGLFPEAPAQP